MGDGSVSEIEMEMEMEEMKKEFNELLEDLRKIHADFRVISTEKVVVAEWVRWKCMFGCRAYGKHLNCPPYVPSIENTKNLISCYDIAIVARFKAEPNYEVTPSRIHHFLWEAIKNMYDKMFEMERHAFLSGYYKAFALYAVPCAYCDPCIPEVEEDIDHTAKRLCPFQHKMRPSMEATGIDVFQTVRNAGYKIKVLTSPYEDIFFFGLLLLE